MHQPVRNGEEDDPYNFDKETDPNVFQMLDRMEERWCGFDGLDGGSFPHPGVCSHHVDHVGAGAMLMLRNPELSYSLKPALPPNTVQISTHKPYECRGCAAPALDFQWSSI